MRTRIATIALISACIAVPLGAMAQQARGGRIYDGPDEVHKSVVARQMLKAYGVDVTI